MKTQPQLERIDPPTKHTATMAPKPPEPLKPTKCMARNAYIEIILLAVALFLWYYYG